MKNILLGILILVASTTTAQTIIGWNQTYNSTTEQYSTRFCDQVNCHIEFGFEYSIVGGVQFYYFQKNDEDSSQMIYFAHDVEYIDNVGEWKIYYTNGVALHGVSKTPIQQEYSLMLKNGDYLHWDLHDEVPELIQLLEIVETDSLDTDSITTIIHTMQPIQEKDTASARFITSKMRTINMQWEDSSSLKNHWYQDIPVIDQYVFEFKENSFEIAELAHSQQPISWQLDATKTQYTNEQWVYTLVTDSDSSYLKLTFPHRFDWNDAQNSDLFSFKLYSTQQPNVLAEFELEKF